jgi:hypothetical protein
MTDEVLFSRGAVSLLLVEPLCPFRPKWAKRTDSALDSARQIQPSSCQREA